MLTNFSRTTAIAAIMLAAAACSGAETTATTSSPESADASAVAASGPEAAPEIADAADAPAAVETAAVQATAPIASVAPAVSTAAAPAPTPVSAAPEEEQPAGAPHVAGVTNHSLPIAKIKNFKLADQTGKVHELYKMTDAKAIVLTMHTKGCPIGQQLIPDFKDLQAKYEPKGVKFLMLNSNLYDTPKMIAEEVKSFSSTIPVLKDPDQSVGEPLGVERATETLVIEPGTWKILYQGPINDRVTYGRARAKADKQYVGGVVDAMLAGQTVTPSFVAPEGCILVFDNRKS